jgi:hypothetical protein
MRQMHSLDFLCLSLAAISKTPFSPALSRSFLMTIPGGEIQLKGVTLDMLMLPLGSRNPVSVTVTAASASAAGATTMSLTASAAGTKIYAGSSLSFIASTTPTRRYQAIIATDCTLGTTATTVDVLPLTGPIASTSTAPWFDGLTPLLGIQDFGSNTQDTTVDTTNTLSGSGTENAMIRSSKTLTVSGIQIPGDRALYTIVKPVTLNFGFYGRELYVARNMPDGEIMRGVAKLGNYNEPGNQNEVKKFSFEMTIQGSTFEYIAPSIFS